MFILQRACLAVLGLTVVGCGASTSETPDGGETARATLCINEFMAENVFTRVDVDAGVRPDWIELHNPGAEPIDLGGFRITDDLDQPDKHVFPAGLVIQAGGYLLLWADGQPLAGDDHLSFRLDRDGEALGLFDPEGRALTALQFGHQVTDWSSAADGSAWVVARKPTPGAANARDCAAQTSADPNAPDSVPAMPDATEELYDPSKLLELRIELSDAAIAALTAQPREYVSGTIEFDGRTYGPIGVRLKGQNSFLPITEKSAFKIKFSEYIDDADFMGVKKLTLNNMRSDPTMMHERLAYLVFRAAGVPASRCNHARVYVNGEYYGLYANVESVRSRMLKRWFDDSQGPLYEGGDVEFLPEFVDLFEHDDGPDDRSNIRGLADAMLLEPASAAIAAAEDHTIMAQFRLFWAVSAAVGQFDAYPYHFDDFFVYDDPTTNRLHFLPWGTDESFDSRVPVGAIFGRMAIRCAQDQDCAIAFVNELFEAVDVLEQLNLGAKMDTIEQQIASAVAQDPRKPYGPSTIAFAREQMRAFISGRRQQLINELTPPP